MLDKGNKVCTGPGPDKCPECADIKPEELQAKEEILHRLLPGVDRIWANSEFTKSLADRFLPTDKEIEIYEHEIPELPYYRKRVRIGYFGYAAPVKGFHILMQAMMEVKWAQLLLFCDVPEGFINGRRIWGMDNVLVMGSYRRDDLPMLCNLVDVAVVPSLNESYGITGREIEMLGVSVLKTNVGGQVGDIEGDNVEALTKAIQEVVDAHS